MLLLPFFNAIGAAIRGPKSQSPSYLFFFHIPALRFPSLNKQSGQLYMARIKGFKAISSGVHFRRRRAAREPHMCFIHHVCVYPPTATLRLHLARRDGRHIWIPQNPLSVCTQTISTLQSCASFSEICNQDSFTWPQITECHCSVRQKASTSTAELTWFWLHFTILVFDPDFSRVFQSNMAFLCRFGAAIYTLSPSGW